MLLLVFFFYSTCPPLHSIIPIHVSTFRDPISDLVVTADYNLIELLYNFLRNGFQPDRNKISNEMKLRLMSGKGEKNGKKRSKKQKQN